MIHATDDETAAHEAFLQRMRDGNYGTCVRCGEDILPDPFAAQFGEQFEASPKASERQIAAMAAGG